ncbi:hypothetical protein [Lysinibacillus antri]|uniref:HipA-like C-terminal domain-containing protein n=1 Tax=Lysinibacillus antri TaxID=2498145 RepID=A0A432LEA8_9BACI|nr:hypothetical protein [Lysinibacillus antri]RUL54169.1 hypothetical protein EK386_06565 [Lysinibacillus antri]
MEIIKIPKGAERIISTSSKGDQSKWHLHNQWIKQNTRGYEGIAEYVASMILANSTLHPSEYVKYTPCEIIVNSFATEGCISPDFRGKYEQEISLERLFEKNFTLTSDILGNSKLSTSEKVAQVIEKVYEFTELDITLPLTRMLAFDAFILNEDRHTNNILFLYDIKEDSWKLAPLFDHGLSLLSDMKDYPKHMDVEILKRKVKAKPFNSSFKKQLALYDGPPFIQVESLKQAILASPYPLGRIPELLELQLNDPMYEKILIRGVNDD